MFRFSHILVAVAFGTLISACATTPSESPFKLKRDDIFARVNTVVIMPIKIVGDLNREEEIAERYESLIGMKLEQAGFKVIPSTQYASLWETMVEQVGGVFDPLTGEADIEKYKTLRELVWREVASRHDAEAFLQPRIEVVRADWHVNQATWHGTSEPTTGKKGFWATLSAPSAQGTIPALSLEVALMDSVGEVYYVHNGGIQLVNHVKGMKFIPVPAHDLFADPARDENAVEIALRPLVQGTPTALH